MSMRRIAAGCVLLLGLSAWSAANADTVTCESNDGQVKNCYANTSRGVWLETQLSRAPCRQGETWGYDRKGVWTSNGCRARFGLGATTSYGGPATSSSDSNANAGAALAALAVVAAGAAAVHHHHEKERRERDDYRDDGYRDDYRYDYRPPQNYGYTRYGGGNDSLRCESEDGRRRFCPIDTRGSRVEMTRQMSRSECRFGRNWGYDRNGVWVDRGCRAEFTVYRN
jgi:hypothetical protein